MRSISFITSSFLAAACALTMGSVVGCGSDSTTDSSGTTSKSASSSSGGGVGGEGAGGKGAGGKGAGGKGSGGEGVGGEGAGGKGAGGKGAGAGGMGAGAGGMGAGAGGMGAGGGGAIACQGSGDKVCGPNGWCNVGTQTCGGAGVCEPRPSICNKDCPMVCGCDGMSYCNTCLANTMGVAVAADAVCQTSGDYSAEFVQGKGGNKIVIGKKESISKQCIRITVANPAPASNIAYMVTTPGSWGIESIVVTSLLSDCDTLSAAIKGKFGAASKASGSVLWKVPVGKKTPCMLNGNVKLSFANQTYTVVPSMLNILNGCK